ncbi:MAG: tRNA1(Val) (adenine(37)-N6)-methyltransferase [Myxococcota bacterium]
MTASDDRVERVPLTRRLLLWQRRRGHRVATDDVVCAWAGVRARPDARRVLDLGCGHGAVTLMLAGALSDAGLDAVEAQEVSHALLVRNITDNGLEGRVRPHLADLRDLDLAERFDLVTGTPPFMPVGTGTLPEDPQRAAARFELRGGVEDYLEAAARHLAPDGVASIVMDAARPERYERAVSAAGLHLHRRVAVRPREGAPPTYLVYQAADAPAEAVEEIDLAVRRPDGAWTDAFRAIRGRLDLPY